MSKKGAAVLITSADKAFDEGKFEQALHSYRKILEAHPQVAPDTQIVFVSKIVMCLYKTDQYSEAPRELKKFQKLFKVGSIPYAKFETLKADVYLDRGDYDAATESGEVAFGLLRTTNETNDILDAQRILGLAYFSKGDLAKARICFEDVLSTSRRKGNVKSVLISLNGLAQTSLFSGRWNQAIEHWKQGLQVSEDEERGKWTASFSLNLGMIHRKIGDWCLAAEYLHSGVKASNSLKHTLGVIRGQISLASLHRLRREWEDAIRLLEKCRKLCEKEGYKRELYLSCEGLGETAFDIHDYEKANEYYSKALKIANEAAPEGDMAVEIHRRLAELSVMLNEPKEALEYAASALRIAKKLGDRFEEACTHRALAFVYQKLGEPEKAHQAFTLAIQSLKELGEKYERGKTLLEYGKFLGSTDKGDEAIQYLLKSQELFGSLPSEYWVGMTELEIAKMRFDKGGMDLAIISLDRATESFEEISSEDSLVECSKLRESVEKAMVETSLHTSYHTIPDGSPEKLLKFLVKKTDATKAFVVLMEGETSEIRATHNIKTDKVKRLVGVFNDPGLRDPVISTDPRSNRLSAVERNGIRSFILIPFGPEEGGGILYLDKRSPFSQKDLTLSVRTADSLALKIAQIRQEELKAENLKLKQELEKRGYPEIITRDKKILEVLNLVDKVKDYSTPVFIEGETGTGKELIARAIHYKGSRAGKPFIALDCGALPETLAENEFFGHKKGSFTDAREDKQGLFELANGGTLFLDEISNLSLTIQAKLLRVLQEERVRRIGGRKERKINVRMIAASNRSMEEEISKGRFREDLYHRLKVMEVNLPLLKDRKEDISLLVQHFIEKCSVDKKKKVEGITPQALDVLHHYKWPGNVRQLKNEIERAIILMDNGWITPALFSPAVRKTKSRKRKKSYNIQEMVRVLKENKWVKRKTARILGIPESTLRRRLKVHNIHPPSGSDADSEI